MENDYTNSTPFGRPNAEKNEFEKPLNAFQDLIDEAKAKKKKETMNDLDKVDDYEINNQTLIDEIALEDDMENTKEIKLFYDNILDNMEQITKIETNEDIEEVITEDVSVESVFIKCAIIGFVTMLAVIGVFYYIMYNI